MQQLSSPEAVYEQRCAEFDAQRLHYEGRWNRLANVRLWLFVGLLVAVAIALSGGVWAWLAAAALFVGFVVTVRQHRTQGRLRQRAALLYAANNEGRQRLSRAWAALPLRRPAPPLDAPSFAADLDVLGHASLQHLLSTPTTPMGLATLQAWLLQPAPSTVALERQAAAAELAPMLDFRDEMQVRGRLTETTGDNAEPFLGWAEGAVWLRRRPLLVWFTRLSPTLILAGAIAQGVGQPGWVVWLPLLVINLVLVLTVGGRADAVFEQVAARRGVFEGYAGLFALLNDQRFNAPLLQRISEALAAGNVRADDQMRRFGRIMAFADLRFWMLYFPFNVVTLWGFHCWWALEGWQQVAGRQTRGWLAALGEIEAVIALATLRHDQPEWAFPELPEHTPVLAGWGVGHPLLPNAARVTNDVQLGPPGTVLLVTGSNMSGKSTLLRAVGLNAVLAHAGGPACAWWFRLPPVTLATSMRVQDSLEQGISYFMAELLRLKQVVDTARRTAASNERRTLFLLDEILHGTNTAERQIAAKHIILHLTQLGAIGAVSTHDLALAHEPEIARIAQPVYFTETFSRTPDGPVMQFDYQLRPGLAPSTNALKLMEIVGLDVVNEENQ